MLNWIIFTNVSWNDYYILHINSLYIFALWLSFAIACRILYCPPVPLFPFILLFAALVWYSADNFSARTLHDIIVGHMKNLVGYIFNASINLDAVSKDQRWRCDVNKTILSCCMLAASARRRPVLHNFFVATFVKKKTCFCHSQFFSLLVQTWRKAQHRRTPMAIYIYVYTTHTVNRQHLMTLDLCVQIWLPSVTSFHPPLPIPICKNPAPFRLKIYDSIV